MSANEESASQKSGEAASPPSYNPAPIDASQFRPFSNRDILYERIANIPFKDSESRSMGYEMDEARRELTCRLMVKFIDDELETLKTEAIVNRDSFALQCLHSIAYESTRQLLLLSQVAPDMVAEVAQYEQVWPIPCSDDTATKNAVDDLLKILKVGTKREDVFDTNNVFSEKTDARSWLGAIAGLMNNIRHEAASVARIHEMVRNENDQTAIIITGMESIPNRNASKEELYEHLKGIVINPDVLARLVQWFKMDNPFGNPDTLRKFITNSVRLPKLYGDRQVVKLWMAVIRELMMDVYDGHPEKSSLGWMGQYLATGKSDSSPKGTASYDSNLRAGMFQRLEKTLLNIAKG